MVPAWPRAENPVLTDVERESLDALLSRLQITAWDFLLVGDASGQTWDGACAWACVSIEKATMERCLWYGFCNRGSINYGETMAYDAPVAWLASREAAKKGRPGVFRVHVVTDSTYTSTGGEKGVALAKTNTVVWDRYESLRRQGILVSWHHSPREKVGLNRFADQASKLVRKLGKTYNVLGRLTGDGAGGVTKTLYDINPAD